MPTRNHRTGKRWRARIRRGQLDFYLGMYDDYQEACVVENQAREKMGVKPMTLNEERGEQKYEPPKSLRRTLAERHVLDWLRKEQKEYAQVKYPISTLEEDDGVLTQRCIDFVAAYLIRAQLIGLDTPSGRQTLGKALSTLYGYTQAACYLHGPMPKPGVPSGEIIEWENAVPLGE